MSRKLVALPGDGIGVEVTRAALQVFRECAARHQLDVEVEEFKAGGQAIEEYGEPMPDFVVEACKSSRAVLLGALGDSKYDSSPAHLRPERGLLRIRKELGLYANLRPIKCYSALLNASPLKPDRIDGVDLLIVRELTGGIYFGEPRGLEDRSEGRAGINSEVYFDYEVERISKTAFEASRKRSRQVTSVDKANVLESSQLWRKVVQEVGRNYPDVSLRHMLVDNCAMQLIARPREFDVLLTTNMFGDILSDEAAMLTGSIGMLPSASLGAFASSGEKGSSGVMGLYEPVHGTAPDIAGQDKANPLAAIASLALLFRYSFDRNDIAHQIEAAIEHTLNAGFRTADISQDGGAVLGTKAMTEKVLEAI
ncbi:MAG: 3-isopropylmalate dehydrogenase [Acidobacteriota bacterium]